MKKRLNFLLILSIIFLVVTIVLGFLAIRFDGFNFPFLSKMSETFNNMENDPGAGWYLIFAGGAAILGDLALGLLLVWYIIFVPFIMNLLIIILQGIARLFQIGVEKDWKKIVSKVLTVLSIIIRILLCLLLLFISLLGFQVSQIILFILLAANIACVVLFIKEYIKMGKGNTQEQIVQ
ncbi:MAG: hypothetical protein IJO43_03650 [Bacilli bacterium]|nr:hypothetical protein [Bacilli bacterium]